MTSAASLSCESCQAENSAGAAFCRECGKPLPRSSEASSGLSWRWIGLGVLIMLATNLVGGFVLGLALGAAGYSLETSQAELIPWFALVGVLAFAIGGFIVGARSPGKTILEPGLAAAIAVALSLAFQGQFNILTMVVGGVVPFLAGVGGGWLGEKLQGTI
jgi:hypothetical protein